MTFLHPQHPTFKAHPLNSSVEHPCWVSPDYGDYSSANFGFGYFAPVWKNVSHIFSSNQTFASPSGRNCYCWEIVLNFTQNSVQWTMPPYSRSYPIPHISLSWRATDTRRSRCHRVAECQLWTVCVWGYLCWQKKPRRRTRTKFLQLLLSQFT